MAAAIPPPIQRRVFDFFAGAETEAAGGNVGCVGVVGNVGCTGGVGCPG
jgi:hypothetical protein